MKKIHSIYMRGGTSKGSCFDMRNLPQNEVERDKMLLH